MKGNTGFQIGTGITSILMIFVVLCLTTFGILSYTTANADANMTSKNALHVEEYYSGYSQISEKLKKIDDIIVAARNECSGDIKENEYFEYVEKKVADEKIEGVTMVWENGHLIFNVAGIINDRQKLMVDVYVKDINDSLRYKAGRYYVYAPTGGGYQEETLPDMWGG